MSTTYYPPVSFHFQVTFEGIGASSDDVRFTEVSGLTAELEVSPYVNAGDISSQYYLPKSKKFSKLVLKRGLMIDTGVATWIKDAINDFDINPTTVTVTLLNGEHQPLSSWTFLDAYPVKWELSPFKSTENGFVVETISLVYSSFEI